RTRADLGAMAGIGLVQLDVRRLDRQPSAARHRVASVDRQIEDDLLDLSGIRPDAPEALVAADRELDVLPEQPSQKWLDRADHRAQIDDLGLENLLAAEGEQLPRQLRGALGALLDQLDVPAVRIMGSQVEEEELAASGDDRQQVVEVMRHTSREPPDGFHLLRLAKLLLQGLLL